MNKSIWFTTVLILFLVFVVPGILVSVIDMIPADDQPGYNPDQRLSIYGKRKVIQKFISRQEDLTAIGTSVRNPNLKNKKEVVLNLYDESDQLIRTSILDGQNIEDGNFIKFVFEPIAGSGDREYKLVLSSPEAGPEETVEVFYIKDSTNEILEYTYDEETHPGGVPLVTFHKPESKWGVVKNVYSSWVQRLF